MNAVSNSNSSSNSLAVRARYPGLASRAANANPVTTTVTTTNDATSARPAQLGLNLDGLKQLLKRMTNPNSQPTQGDSGSKTTSPATYTVRSGDTLWQIASRTLGSGMRWEDIWNLNKDKISNPDRIFPGMVLKMPDPSKATEPTKPAEATKPTETTLPTQPTKPAEATTPTKPTEPTKPAETTQPTKPTEPTKPAEVTKPTEPTKVAEPNGSGPLLQIGAKGDAVSKLQTRLKELGFDPGTIDGDFGLNTTSAVQNFQASKGLEVDGVVGPETWKQLGITVDGGSSSSAPAQSTPVQSTPAPAKTSEPNGSGPMLKSGANGDAVGKLQSRLKELGFDPGAIDGDFGPNTETAVKSFQSSKGLEVDGVVGPNTWKQLGITVDGASSTSAAAKSSEPNGSGPLLKNGATGDAVKQLQSRLQELGFDCGGADGDFGNNTANAVKRFQASKGLEADGVVGPQTWKQLGITVSGGVSSSSSSSGGSGPLLQSGAQGDPVKQLQSRLQALGFDCGGADGDFGNNTASAVKRFQASKGLEADGVVGPQTWNALGINVSGSVSYASGVSGASTASSSAIVQGAYALHNSGYRYPVNLTDQYEYVPFKIGCCADFVCDSYRKAGSNINADMTSKGYNPHYCPSMINYFKKYQQYISGQMGARPGDVVFFNWDGGEVDHVAIVAEVDSKGRPTKLVESRHFDSPTEITTMTSSRAACIVGYGRLG